MRKRGRESRTAVCSSTGILTRPNAIEPFHRALAMERGSCNSQTPNSQLPNPKPKPQLGVVREAWQLGVGGWELGFTAFVASAVPAQPPPNRPGPGRRL